MFVNKEVINDLIDKFKNWKEINLTYNHNRYNKQETVFTVNNLYTYHETKALKRGNILNFSFLSNFDFSVTFAKEKKSYYKRMENTEINRVKIYFEKLFDSYNNFFYNGFFKIKHLLFITFLLCQGFTIIERNCKDNKAYKSYSVLRLHMDDLLIEYDAEKMIFIKAQKSEKIKNLKLAKYINTDFFYEVNIDYEENKIAFFKPGTKKRIDSSNFSQLAKLCNFSELYFINCTNKYLYFLNFNNNKLVNNRIKFKQNKAQIKIIDKFDYYEECEKSVNEIKFLNNEIIRLEVINKTKEINNNCHFIKNIFIKDNKFYKTNINTELNIRKNEIIDSNYVLDNGEKAESIIKYFLKENSRVVQNIYALKNIKAFKVNNEFVLVYCNGKIGLVDVKDKFYNDNPKKMIKNIKKNFNEWIRNQDVIAMMKGI